MRMRRNPLAYGIPFEQAGHDPNLWRWRVELVDVMAKRLDAALLDAAAACASRDETLALERQLHVAQRGVLMEPPHEFDEDGNIIIERRDRYY